MKTMQKLITSAALVAAGLLAGCGKGQPKMGAMPPAEVGVATVQAAARPLVNELPGRIEAVRTAQVRARATGILLKRLFEEGSEVKEGQVLFQIDPAPLQASYDSAQANVAKSQATLHQAEVKTDRYKILIKNNAISKQDYDDQVATLEQSQADVEANQAALETAKLNLGYASVNAPISGRIGRAAVTEGAYVTSTDATQLATIQQMDTVYFDFTQSSNELLKLKKALDSGKLQSVAPGEAKVTLVLDDGSDYPHEGKLLFSEVTVDQSTGMITLRAEFPNPERLLLPGMYARGRVEQAVDEKAVTVPQQAVSRGADGSASVLLVGADNKVEVRKIKTSDAVGDQWIVTSGLQGGEKVIVDGLQKAKPGAEVKPVPFAGAKAAASPAAQ